VNITVPFDADLYTPRKVTSIARVGYDRLFGRVEEGLFSHDYSGGLKVFDELEGTDVDAAAKGWVSITPVRMPDAATVPDEVVRAVEV